MLILGVEIPSKREVNIKSGGVLEVVLPGRGQMTYLGGRENLSGGSGVGGNYTDYL